MIPLLQIARIAPRRGLRAAGLAALLLAAGPATTSAVLGAAPATHPLLITIDDLPLQGPAADPQTRKRVTQGLIDALAKHHAKAVAFVVWDRVRNAEDEELLEMWLAAGHELGSHSATHPNLTEITLDAYIADLKQAKQGLDRFLTARSHPPSRYFRFPFLNEGDTEQKLTAVRQALKELGHDNLPVTIDTQDWSFAAPWVAARKADDRAELARLSERYHRALRTSVTHHTERGDDLLQRTTPQTLLLHANEIGATQWHTLFDWLVRSGFRLVDQSPQSLEKFLSDPVFREQPDFVFRQGVSLWDRIAHQREWEAAQQAVRTLLADQSAAWSRGDLDAFCSVYAADTLFISPTGLTRGREAVLARYKARYPTNAEMGTLTLTIEELRPVWGPEVSMLDDSVPSRIHGVSVAARWSLRRLAKQDELSGWTLLVLHRIGREWRIIQDASM